MPDAFPAVGRKYLVDLHSTTGAGFRVQLDFASASSLTYTGIDANGNPSRTVPRQLASRSNRSETSFFWSLGRKPTARPWRISKTTR